MTYNVFGGTLNLAQIVLIVCCGLPLQGSLLDLNELAVHAAELIVNRGYLERRHNTSEDDGLLGLLTLATVICKHNPPFKSSPSGQVIHC